MLFCTSICSNYLPKAMVLAESIKHHHPQAKVIICLLEKEIPPQAMKFQYFDRIVLAKDLGIENFEHHIFKHLLVEAATSVKGQLFRFLLDQFPLETKFIYLDPDIKVFSPLIELDNFLDHHQIVLTPHLCEPEDTVFDIKHNEFNSLRHGIFNLGFLAIRRGEISEKFIDWWRKRLELFCYDDKENGIFTDQKWIDLSVGFFDVYIMRNPGYNLAPWNYSKRNLSLGVNGECLVNGEPLRFIHFSGFDSGANEMVMKKYKPDTNDLIYQLTTDYRADLIRMNEVFPDEMAWSYGFFDSGEKIDNKARLTYRQNSIFEQIFMHPFSYNNAAFLGLYSQIGDEEWKEVCNVQLKTIQLNQHFLEAFRLNLCILKNQFEADEIDYFIWGAGASGSITQKIMSKILTNFKFKGFIDKYKRGSFEGFQIIEPEKFQFNHQNYIIISTSLGKEEVENILSDQGLEKLKNYYYGYGIL